MTRESFDVFIAGGGIAGLVCAAALDAAGFSVLLADPAAAPDETESDGADLRSTAFLQPARDLLDRIGLWDDLRPGATPLCALRIVDSRGWPPEIAETRRFEAADLGAAQFGWNLPNWRTAARIARHLAARPGVSLAWGAGFRGMTARTSGARVALSDGRRVDARLVIGADGRASAVREAAGIPVGITRYGQKALAFAATHERPHDQVSTEIYNSGGAFTTVPLPDQQGRPASAIVWMNDAARALELAAAEPPAFGAAMTRRACGLLGEMRLATRRQVWPVVTQRARRLTAERTALIAEAAHVLPPIGAQGLNASLRDVAALAGLAAEAPGALGDEAMLARYAADREADIARRARVIDLFNRICKSGAAPIQALRAAGLRRLYDTGPLRRAVMQAGLGR